MRHGKALHGAREILARGIEQRVVVEPGVAAGRPGARLPVQHEQVLAADAERGDGVLAPVQREPERVLVEADRAIEVGDGQMRRAESERVRSGRGHRSMMADQARREAKKSTSSAAHCSRSRPPSTCGRWLKRGSASTSITLPAAPAFGSAVP